MAQLSEDSFAFGGPMLSVDEAVEIIASRVKAVGETEAVSLGEADGRILARDIAAPLPLPPFTNSAVDGYAVNGGDLPPARVHLSGKPVRRQAASLRRSRHNHRPQNW
jgi:molybdopterin molybdotransferase